MPPGEPIKRYTGAADGRTIGAVLNELVDEVNSLTEVLALISETVIESLNAKELTEFALKLAELGNEKPNEKRSM